MEKNRPVRTEQAPTRRVFLQRVAGTGLATAAGIALLPGLTEAGKGTTTVPPLGSTGTGTQTGTTTGTTGTTTTTTGVTGTTGATTGTTTGAVAAAMGSDVAALNFLLMIEELQAAFYNQNAGNAYLTSDTTGLAGITTEIRTHENAHVAALTTLLGSLAEPVPSFQNLLAPTLTQFLLMAVMFEDIGLSAYQGQLPQIQDKGIQATVAAIEDVEGRHAGGLRAYRKIISTAAGGDPNVTLTEDGQAENPVRTQTQVLALVSNFIVGLAAAQPATTGGTTTATTTTTGTTTTGTTAGGITTGGTTTGTTTGATTGTTTGVTGTTTGVTGTTTATTTGGTTTAATTGGTTATTTTGVTATTTATTTGGTTTGGVY